MYDNQESALVIVDTLAEAFTIPKYIVKKIIEWRLPWNCIVYASSPAAISTYLTSRTSGGLPVANMIGISKEVS